MGLFGIGGNRKITRNAINRAEDGTDYARGEMRGSNDRVKDLLDKIANYRDEAYADGEQTMDERFGRQIQTSGDRIQANTDGAQNAIAEALMARGGDISGTGATALSQTTQGGNEAQSKNINQFKMLTDRENRMDKRRGDQLNSRMLSGSESAARRNQSLYDSERAMLSQAELQEIQRRTANKQFGLDVFSTALDTINPFDNSGGE